MDEERGNLLAFPQAPDAIELRHLRAFVAVAEELNFGRAAERLYISQPALSRQIRALERLLGCVLLQRTTHRVELTVAGEALLDRTRQLLRDVDAAVSATQSIGGEIMERVARFWQPVVDVVSGDADLQELRNAYEELLAQFSPPPEIGVRSINAGGVPSLLLSSEAGQPVTQLYLHGGGYVLGSAFGYRPLAAALAAAADAAALIPEYRLAPEHPYPAALEDAVRAYQWILDRGVPPGDITVAGDSVGGGLVLSLLLSLRERGLPLPGGTVLFCPGIDLTGSTFEKLEHDHVGMAREALQRFADIYLDGHPVDDPIVSPLKADLSGLPPMLVQAATGDLQREDARQLVERAQAHGVDARLELYAVDTHVFQIFWSFLPEAADALRQAGEFALARRAALRRAGS